MKPGNYGPLPPPPLGNRPEGLLSLLEIQTGGRYPQHLAENLQSTMDLTSLYLANKVKRIMGTFNTIGAAGATAQWTSVPNNEKWWILRAFADSQNVAAGISQLDFTIVYTTDGTTYPGTNGGGNLLAPAGYPFIGADLPHKCQEWSSMILPPGTRLWGYTTRYGGAGTYNLNLRLDYVPLPI